jgi:DNA-binding beta-propeller fold protein YncE
MPVALAVDTRTQHAFVRNGDGTVSVLDLTRGTPLRTVVVSKPDANAKGLAVDEQTGRIFVTSGSAVSVLDATSGSLLRKVRLGAFPVDIGVDTTANRVFVPTGFGTVSMLDARSGALLRTVHTGGAPDLPPAVAVDERTRRVFVSATNFVKVLDATTGALLRTVAGVAPGVASIAVDAATSRVFLATFTGPGRGSVSFVKGLSILDARDGTLLRSLGLRQGYDNSDVGALVVDERAGAHVPCSAWRSDGQDRQRRPGTWPPHVIIPRRDGDDLDGDGDDHRQRDARVPQREPGGVAERHAMLAGSTTWPEVSPAPL